MAFDMAADGRGCNFAPSGASTSFRPPRLLIEIGTRTVTVRPSSLSFGLAITPPSGLPV